MHQVLTLSKSFNPVGGVFNETVKGFGRFEDLEEENYIEEKKRKPETGPIKTIMSHQKDFIGTAQKLICNRDEI